MNYSEVKRINYLLLLILCLPFFWLACKSKDKKVPDENFADQIYFDYKISVEEGYDNLTVHLKYRDGLKSGEAFTPAILEKVILDDEILTPDSSKMGGTFYEIQKPIDAFTGKHTITFLTKNKKEYKEEINFTPIVLTTDIPADIQREDLVLNFTGLEDEDYIRLLLTDTSFFNDGINRIDTVRNNQLILTKKDFEKLANGPILLEFVREYEKPINTSSAAGGRLRINYTLRRSFNLQD